MAPRLKVEARTNSLRVMRCGTRLTTSRPDERFIRLYVIGAAGRRFTGLSFL